MNPHIDELVPAQERPGRWILISGTGFRPNDVYLRAVLFRSAVDGATRSAEAQHVLQEDGQIADDRLRARVPWLLPGGATVWVENIEILPPSGGGQPHPGEPPTIPEPNYQLYSSNQVGFVVECFPPHESLTEATMPPEVKQQIEVSILELQALLGGAQPFDLPEVKHNSDYCWGYRTKNLRGRLTLDQITTAWQGNRWTITTTAHLRIRGDLDLLTPATGCQWARWGSFSIGGGGHRWEFSVAPCGAPCDDETTSAERVLQLHYVASAYHPGGLDFDDFPDDFEGEYRDRIRSEIKSRTLGPDSPLLQLFALMGEIGYRQAHGCPNLSLSDVCAVVTAAEALEQPEPVLERLRAVRDGVLANSATGRVLISLANALGHELSGVLRRDPLLRARAAAWILELDSDLRARDATRRNLLPAERLARAHEMLRLAGPRLSPLTAAVLEAMAERAEVFEGATLNSLPKVLAAWRVPRAVKVLFDVVSGRLVTGRSARAPRPVRRPKPAAKARKRPRP